MRCVIYARCSTDSQDTDNQTLALEQWAKSRDFEVLKVYSENESAWHNGHQHALKRLVSDARHRKFDVVLIWALDRLSREGSSAILNIIHRLSSCDVKVYSYQESWTEAPGELGELLFSIAGWVAKMESERRSERIKAGMEKRKANGLPVGRKPGAADKQPRRRRGYFKR